MRSALQAAALTTAGALLALAVAVIPTSSHPTAPLPAPTANQEPRP